MTDGEIIDNYGVFEEKPMDEFEKIRAEEQQQVKDLAKNILDGIDHEIEKAGITANQVLMVYETIMEDLNESHNVLDGEIKGHYEDSAIECSDCGAMSGHDEDCITQNI